MIKCKTDSRQLDKYQQYVDEMERVTRLLLLLAGRLARHDNSVQQLPPSGDSQRNIRVIFVLRPSVVCLSVTLCIVPNVAKRCVLEQKLLLTAYRKSYMRYRLVPK